MKRLSCVVFFWMAVLVMSARADGAADDQYIMVYGLIQEADSLSVEHPAQALARYHDAYDALQAFKKIYPDWNDRIVSFRLDYLQGRITDLTPKAAVVPVPPTNAPTQQNPVTVQAPPAANTETDRQLSALNDQLKELESEKQTLEAKLKEAYATQPAAVDPRELERANEKIASLLKENDLLKVTLANQPAGAVAGSKAVDDIKRVLADTSRKLDEQTERANNLALEKQVLQGRLDTLASQTNGTANLEATKLALVDANQQLASQKALTDKYSQERGALQDRIQALTVSAAAAASALRAENDDLKKQLAEARSTVAKSQDQSQKLADAQTQVASLQSENGVLRLEKSALEDRVRRATDHTGDQAQIKQLESERDEFRQKFEAASKQAAMRPSKKAAAKINELSNQVTGLRARIDVLEAQRVPFTTEELALFRKSASQLEASVTRSNKTASVRELPPGTAMLAAEAQRDFEAKRFDQAQEKYQEILRQDDKNIYTLANLAAIELEMNDLPTAEKYITQAITIAPDDGYNLSILGYLKFRQEKYDEALDALSRAAKINPDNPEIQNYLGVTLSHKGLRIPAETALRKAIQIDPSYANAHNNLAVIYATQQPPLLELARWHYQKALDAGQPRNPDLEKLLQLKTE